MSPEILEYLLRTTAIWTVLLAYYGLTMQRAGFGVRRAYLLGTWLFGLLIPLLPPLVGSAPVPVVNLPNLAFDPVIIVPEATGKTVQISWSWADFLPYAYLLGVLFFGARTLVRSRLLLRWSRSGAKDWYQGFRVIRHREIPGPFAAWGTVFLPADPEAADLTHTALLHETAHLRARHHYDHFLLTIGILLLWFHPLVWVYRRLLMTVHEYQADAAVLQRVSARTYGRQLLQAAMGPTPFPGLFSSPLKQRIMMFSKNREQKRFRLPLLGTGLLLLVLMLACSDLADDIQPSLTEEIPGLELIAGDLTEISIPDEFPKPAGLEAEAPTWETMIQGIYQEIRYPKAARMAGQEGAIRL
ncbi:MAG: M56 family metallopeptidase, partial [Bacteroidota bacterium]